MCIRDSGSVPNCSQAGIIGAVAGIIGCIQALEAIKYLLGIGELLTGKMLVMDGLTMNTRVVKFPSKNKNCLLYTSDAADEEDSDDIGSRRIIKKKKKKHPPSA